MMATTHVLVGLMLATLTTVFAPDFTGVALLAAGVGGAFPDLDLYAGHRKSLHFPVYYPVFAFCALAIAAVLPTAVTVGLAFFLLSAAVHARMDAFGGGLELKPWVAQSHRGVYDHARDRWVEPRRWIRYDGAPEDLLFAAVVAIPVLVAFDGLVRQIVVAILVISTVYTVVRKPVVHLTESVVEVLPLSVLRYVPDRFIEDVETV